MEYAMVAHPRCLILLIVSLVLPVYAQPTEFSVNCRNYFAYGEFDEAVISGGPPPDGIPPIEEPGHESVADASLWLKPETRVFVVEDSRGAFIFPQPIMVLHEVLNGVFNGRPGTFTYCPLAGSAIGYYTDFTEPHTTLGTSGRLLNGALVMYDRQSSSYWPQILGEAINGDYRGTKLESFPVFWTQWAQAEAAYPDAKVLSRDSGFSWRYNFDPYGDYIDERGHYFNERTWPALMNEDDRLHPKRSVIGIKTSCGRAAIVKDHLGPARPLLNIDVANAPVVAFYDAALGTVRTFSRIHDDTVLEFSVKNGKIEDQITGTVWNHKGQAISGQWSGAQLKSTESMESFWFTWIAYYPDTVLIGASN
jgi:hypothetical protein